MNKKPIIPPSPRHINKPLAQPKGGAQARPKTAALMARCKAIRDESEGKIDNASIATALGITKAEVCEHLGAYRSAPSSESTISYILLFLGHDKNLLKNLPTPNLTLL